MTLMRKKWIVVFLILAFGFEHEAIAMASERSPASVVSEVVALVKEIEQKPAVAATNSKEVSMRLDIRGVGRRCLGSTWDRLGRDERNRFIHLFTTLLEKVAYPKSGKFFDNIQIAVDQEKVQDGKAFVKTSVYHPDEGRIGVDYRLQHVSGHWLITDIILDGVSLVVDLKSQMQKIVRENSYEELIRRMEKKIEENENRDTP